MMLIYRGGAPWRPQRMESRCVSHDKARLIADLQTRGLSTVKGEPSSDKYSDVCVELAVRQYFLHHRKKQEPNVTAPGMNVGERSRPRR